MSSSFSVDHDDSATGDLVALPDNFFPACWADDARMSVLFAPFRAKSLNPVNYDSKLAFWRNLIRKYSEAKGSARITLPELRRAFQRNGKKPYALETVLFEMANAGEVKNMGAFMEAPQHTWRDWAHRSLFKVMSWPVHQVRNRLWLPSKDEQAGSCSIVVCSVVKVINSYASETKSK